ncbi:MAG TPA: hypothetical protein VGD01_02595 [Candidatus Elarobacter sp.]
MSKRAVTISGTFTPGRNRGQTRTVTVDEIPAIAITYEGTTENHLTFEVADRLDTLMDQALESNDLADQRITYSPWPLGEPVEPRPWDRRLRRGGDGQMSASAGALR